MAKDRSKKEKGSVAQLPKKDFGFNSFNFRALLLVAVGIILYSNTLFNEYALDDGIVIEKNLYVQEGLRGVPKIMSTDAYESYYKQMNAKQQLAGGRYRPLSIVTFAIEQQLFGSKEKGKPKDDVAGIRHFLNVAFYILSIVALFYFLLHFIFPAQPDVAFLTSLIFLIHPMHTEVIANVKSRDEILSFLFIILTLISVFRYVREGKKRNLIFGMVFYFMALLSKEYAVSLVVLIPLLLYIQEKNTLKEAIFKAIPFGFVAIVYLLIRFKIVGVGSTVENTDVLNNPYMYATAVEKLGTKIFVLGKYLCLLFFPHPLSSDYSYNTIPYLKMTDWRVLLSLMVHLGMVVAFVVFFIRRSIIAFALGFYLIHLFMISNLKMEIGATMGERLVYHSSLGFAIIIALAINRLLEKANQKTVRNTALISFSLIITAASAIVVIPRNNDWKNDNTLFIKDAETVPNSALVNGNAGKAYVDLSEMPENKPREKELITKAIYHLNRSVSIHKLYVNGYLNLGVCYFKLKDYDKAKMYWDKAKEIFPNNPYLKTNFPLLGMAYLNEALRIGGKNPQQAIILLEKAVESDPGNPELWYNLGGASYTVNNFKRAQEAWMKTLELKPDHAQAKQGLAAIPPQQ
jgi:protein O-mannosyl-transferase